MLDVLKVPQMMLSSGISGGGIKHEETETVQWSEDRKGEGPSIVLRIKNKGSLLYGHDNQKDLKDV